MILVLRWEIAVHLISFVNDGRKTGRTGMQKQDQI
jgi:hypothetical protein